MFNSFTNFSKDSFRISSKDFLWIPTKHYFKNSPRDSLRLSFKDFFKSSSSHYFRHFYQHLWVPYKFGKGIQNNNLNVHLTFIHCHKLTIMQLVLRKKINVIKVCMGNSNFKYLWRWTKFLDSILSRYLINISLPFRW